MTVTDLRFPASETDEVSQFDIAKSLTASASARAFPQSAKGGNVNSLTVVLASDWISRKVPFRPDQRPNSWRGMNCWVVVPVGFYI